MTSIAKPALAMSPGLTSPRSSRRSAWLTPTCILASDLLALSLVCCFTVAGRHLITPSYHLTAFTEFFPFVAMLLPAFLLQGLYPGMLIHPAEEMRRIFYSVSVVFLIWASVTFLWRTGGLYSRSVFLITWTAGSPVVLLFRYATRRCFGHQPWWGVRAVVLGSGPTAQRIVRKLRNGMLGVKVAGVFSEEQVLSWAHDMPPVLGHLQSASRVAGSHFAQYAIVALPNKSNRELSSAIQEYCRGFSHVLLAPDIPDVCSLGMTARDIGGELGLELPQRLFRRSASRVKRLLDGGASFALLVILAPLFGIIAAAIKLTSKGPVFYVHPRLGRDGQPFKTLKFRTMVSDADRVLADYLIMQPEDSLEWQRDHKLKRDPRITKVGRLLRRSSLDELPQLLNVFLGQMSLVGPRPIVPDEVPKYGRGYGLYMRVLPGITGLWQVSGRSNTTYDERVGYDRYYIHNWSIWLDIYILVCTIAAVVKGQGAY